MNSNRHTASSILDSTDVDAQQNADLSADQRQQLLDETRDVADHVDRLLPDIAQTEARLVDDLGTQKGVVVINSPVGPPVSKNIGTPANPDTAPYLTDEQKRDIATSFVANVVGQLIAADTQTDGWPSS
ncbi:DUF5811 family protein [Halovenus sp. HT40]|uniref:DUF5811 family protein n=1 Tax=Halovenus sp. HT40 TaxID=3126691 RepID=UPI00300F05A2